MLGFVNKAISGIFGSKSARDLKELNPIVEKVNTAAASVASLGNNQLREKTAEFKARIAEFLQEVDQEIASLEARAEGDPDMDMHEKEAVYTRVDQLKKERKSRTETILNELLPEAFAVVKETARRFTDQAELEATATDLDRLLATKKANVVIDGDTVRYKNKWVAAGN